MKRIKANGVELAVVDQGAGAPVLFVHGFPLSHAMWQPQIDALQSSHRVIAPDLRGFGGSNFAGGSGTNALSEPRVSMEEFAEDMLALLDALDLNEPVTFCGLSMGGYVGWQFIRKYPERVARLVVCDSRAVADSPEAAKGRGELAKKVLAEGSTPVAEAMLPKLLAEKTIKNQPKVVEAVQQMIAAASRQGIAAALLGMAARPDATGLLPKIAVPTLLIVGQHDAISTVDEMRGIAEKIPGAQLSVISEAGHMTTIENPTAFNEALVKFLAS
jgi:pimeloyl-ACP methyl ester carboxylesterase